VNHSSIGGKATSIVLFKTAVSQLLRRNLYITLTVDYFGWEENLINLESFSPENSIFLALLLGI